MNEFGAPGCRGLVSKSQGIAFFAALAFLVLVGAQAKAETPPGCTGNGSGGQINFLVGGVPQPNVTVHVGDTLFYQVRASVGPAACKATNVNAFLKTADGVIIQWLSNMTLDQGEEIICPGNSKCINTNLLRYTVRSQDLGQPVAITNADPVTGIPVVCSSASAANNAVAVQQVLGRSLTGNDSTIQDSTYNDCRNIAATVFVPCIACTKSCVNAVGQNGSITFSGSVTNCGISTPLFNVSVSNFVNGGFVLVTNISQLNPNQSVSFSGSYVPANPCLPTLDTIFVRGTDALGSNVTSQCSQTCSNILTTCLTVTKNCDTVAIGQGNLVSGLVTNCGNVTIANITVTDNLYGLLTTITTLAPGQSQTYSRLVTNSTCGNFTNTVTASGTNICGAPVSAMASSVCTVTESPCIRVTKLCDSVLVGLGNTV